MNVQFDAVNVPSESHLEVNIHLSAAVHITAAVARRRVNRLVISEIGNLLYAGEPSLVVGKRICWRVPVLLAYPSTGPTGPVGTLDVDVDTGEVIATSENIVEITDYAHFLAQRTPPRPE